MRLSLPILAVPLAVVLSGCGGSPGSQPTPSTTSASPSPSPTLAALLPFQLDPALLAAADMGSGWTSTAPVDFGPQAPQPTAADRCDFPSLSARLPQASFGRQVSLAHAASSTSLRQGVGVHDPGAADAIFTEISRLLAACPTLRIPDGDGRADVRYSRLPVGRLGDHTVALAISLTRSGQSSGPTAVFVTFSRGDIVVTITGTGSSSMRGFATTAATKAAAKLAALVASHPGAASAPPVS